MLVPAMPSVEAIWCMELSQIMVRYSLIFCTVRRKTNTLPSILPDAALAASGTVTLGACLCQGANGRGLQNGKTRIQPAPLSSPFIPLCWPIWCLVKMFFPEFLQENCTPKALAQFGQRSFAREHQRSKAQQAGLDLALSLKSCWKIQRQALRLQRSLCLTLEQVGSSH